MTYARAKKFLQTPTLPHHCPRSLASAAAQLLSTLEWISRCQRPCWPTSAHSLTGSASAHPPQLRWRVLTSPSRRACPRPRCSPTSAVTAAHNPRDFGGESQPRPADSPAARAHTPRNVGGESQPRPADGPVPGRAAVLAPRDGLLLPAPVLAHLAPQPQRKGWPTDPDALGGGCARPMRVSPEISHPPSNVVTQAGVGVMSKQRLCDEPHPHPDLCGAAPRPQRALCLALTERNLNENSA